MRYGVTLPPFGPLADPRVVRDLAVAAVTGLLSGERFDHEGEHYRARDARFRPAPLRGRIPIWVGAQWPHRRPLARAARFDGVYVLGARPEDLDALRETIEQARPDGLAGFDLVVQGRVGTDPGPWAAAGATWWLNTFDPFTVRTDEVRAVIDAGPPT